MITRCAELDTLCAQVKELVKNGNGSQADDLICKAMSAYPHAPQPHNLLGVLLELQGKHVAAMNHFRAALALDPTYRPANTNLNTCGSGFTKGSCAFDESDCQRTGSGYYTMSYDSRKIGHVIRRD